MKKFWKKGLALCLSCLIALEAPFHFPALVGRSYGAERPATVQATSLNVRSAPGTGNTIIGKLSYGAAVTVLGEASASDGAVWYQIRFTGTGGIQATGYVLSSYIKFPTTYSTSSDFEAYLNSQGFPESYRPALRELHAKYPQWIFTAFNTGLDWNDVIQNESLVGRNLVSSSSISSWKSTADGAYDWGSSTWPGFDGSTWVAASEDIIRYYMDPRNFINETYIFQFLSQSYDASIHTREGLVSLVKGTFLEGSAPVGSTYAGAGVSDGAGGVGSPAAGPGDTGNAGNAGNTGGTGGGSSSGTVYGPGASDPSGGASANGNGQNAGGGVTVGVAPGGSAVAGGSSGGGSTGAGAVSGVGSSNAGVVSGVGGAGTGAVSGVGGTGAGVITGVAPGGGVGVNPGAGSGGGAAPDVSSSNVQVGVSPGMNLSRAEASGPVGGKDNGLSVSPHQADRVAATIIRVGPGGDGSSSSGGGVSGPSSGASGAASTGRTAPYVDILMQAGVESGVNPYVLAAMILQEQGSQGNSQSISGAGGYYNFYNFEAYASNGMTAVQRGLWYASQSGDYMRPWNTIDKSIIGGACQYGQNYVNAGQNTFYLKKFNVQGSNIYKHQYMTNVEGAASEGAKMGAAYSESMRQTAMQFSIPVYRNMPAEACSRPVIDGSPNNKLSLISIDGFTISPAFNRDTNLYNVTVNSSVTSVVLRAAAIDSSAQISGTGTVNLTDAVTDATIFVTAQNGYVREYTVRITRSDSGPFSNGTVGSGSAGGVSSGSNYGPGGSGGSGAGSGLGSSSGNSGSGGPGAGSASGQSASGALTGPGGSNVTIVY